MAARTAARKLAQKERLSCPDCGRTYEVAAGSLGPEGRRVKCPSCQSVWVEFPPGLGREQGAGNPVLRRGFPFRLRVYLNGLPEAVKRNSGKTTHAIKSFLMREGLGAGTTGYANGLRVDLRHFKNSEFLWDATGRVRSPDHPDEDVDLAFVAESENQPAIEKILEDANKLPIVRADARLMFFRANDRRGLDYAFERLFGLFSRHRKSEPGDVYILAGLDAQALTYVVRKLTIPREMANASPWEEF